MRKGYFRDDGVYVMGDFATALYLIARFGIPIIVVLVLILLDALGVQWR